MSKRKLTKRQRFRIQTKQQALAARVGQQASDDERWDDTLRLGQLGREQPGLIIAHYGAQVEVEPLDAAITPKSVEPDFIAADATKLMPLDACSSSAATGIIRRCHFRSHVGALVAGDRVIWRDGDPIGLVVAVAPRKTELCRPDPYGDLKAIAANIDRLLVVIAPFPEPHSQLIDRYIVAAEAANIQPVLILNKSDRLTADNGPQLRALLSVYRSIGYPALETSAISEHGLEPLMQLLEQGTSAVVGQSGVGKSSLVNALIPTANTAVGALSTAAQKGAHTTTTARFFHLPGNGSLIDSPGIRKFGLWHMDEQTILNGFVELRPFIGHCRFRDCQHMQEPGCRIRQAFEDEHICAARMQSFEYLRNNAHVTYGAKSSKNGRR